MTPPTPPESDPRWVGLIMDTTFYVLLIASLSRFLLRHQGPLIPWVVTLSLALAVLYALGSHRTATFGPRSLPADRAARPLSAASGSTRVSPPGMK